MTFNRLILKSSQWSEKMKQLKTAFFFCKSTFLLLFPLRASPHGTGSINHEAVVRQFEIRISSEAFSITENDFGWLKVPLFPADAKQSINFNHLIPFSGIMGPSSRYSLTDCWTLHIHERPKIWGNAFTTHRRVDATDTICTAEGFRWALHKFSRFHLLTCFFYSLLKASTNARFPRRLLSGTLYIWR